MSFNASIAPHDANDIGSCAAVTKERTISNGVSVSRLNSGNFAVAVHDGERRVIVELTPGELLSRPVNS
jgi:DNA gyrase inhibitor GyrI